MSRTITAMFDSRSEAESARARLSSSGIEADRVPDLKRSRCGRCCIRAAGHHRDDSPNLASERCDRSGARSVLRGEI